jgi:glucosylceramidase
MDVVRISIAASDLNETAFTYNDMPAGKLILN